MSKTMFAKIRGPLLAIGLSIGACDDSDGDLDAEGSEGQELEENYVERELCVYFAGPPGTDDTATLVGAVTEVDTEDEPSAAPCDLHMFRVTAAPAASRARTVGFDAHSFSGFDHIGARLWARTCTGGICSAFSAIPVPALTQMPGLCNQFVCVPSLVYGEVTLPANNTFTDIRAGMRVLDGDGDVVPVAITVSE
jgi:hypothetical protein